jgi:hypothetical protein
MIVVFKLYSSHHLISYVWVSRYKAIGNDVDVRNPQNDKRLKMISVGTVVAASTQLSTIRGSEVKYMKSLIIIRLDYYLTSLLTKIVSITRTCQATVPQSVGFPYKSVRRLICAYLQGPQFLSLEPKPRLI